MASRLVSRFSRRIAGAARPIGLSPARPHPPTLPPPPSFFQTEVASVDPTKLLRQPFIVNSTLQRFGYSSSAPTCPPTLGANLTSAKEGLKSGEISIANYQRFSSSYTGFRKFLPYTVLFRWIEEIILDYVHHEITRNMVMLYLRVFLIILMKDVFIGCYDLLTPEA